MKFESTSSGSALIANGKAAHVANPWNIVIDTDEETITVSIRNWYLIGIDTQIIAFRFIRSIRIDEHLIGADIHIKVVGGTASAYCIPKSDARRIKEILMDYNFTKKGKGIIFS
jgi:hypothetical protein